MIKKKPSQCRVVWVGCTCEIMRNYCKWVILVLHVTLQLFWRLSQKYFLSIEYQSGIRKELCFYRISLHYFFKFSQHLFETTWVIRKVARKYYSKAIGESQIPCDTGNHVTLKFVGALFPEKIWNNYGTPVK